MAPKYEQHYRKSWEILREFKGWLRPVEKDSTRAFCAYCKCELYAKFTDLKKHSQTQKHKKCSNPFTSSQQARLPFKPSEQSVSATAEASIAMFIAEHCAILSSDHLTQLCKAKFGDSRAACELKLGRTKCRDIIVNVLAPHFSDILRDDIGENGYSVLIDESTDISTTKVLGVCIRYFSTTLKKIVCTHLGLVEMETGTAIAIAKAVKDLLNSLCLKRERMIGLGVDNASVNTGASNGAYEHLKRELDIPNLIMMRCVCHSLQLAISRATEETLPRNVDFLVRETYNWFSHSTKRQSLYRILYKAINNEEPLKITRMCDTRWLSIEPAVTRILVQWEELKLHFQVARTSENCYAAELLYNMYSDPVNKLYMHFLKPVLQEVQRTNKAFQSENSDPFKLLEDLTNLIRSVTAKVIIPTANIDPLSANIDSFLDPKPYLGYEFEKMISEERVSMETEAVLRKRCISFVLKLIRELKNRLPNNFEILQKMSILSVNSCLKPIKEPIIDLAGKLGYGPQTMDAIINQWRNINFVNWTNTSNTVEFWIEVGQYRDSTGTNPFQELWCLAVKCLSLPHSNAEVERLFSQLSIVKSKLRNRMKTKTANAILAVRSGLRRLGKCCCTYEPPESVLKFLGTMATYEGNEEVLANFDDLL